MKNLDSAKRTLIGATAATLILGFIPGAEIVTYPIRLFSTIVHEGGHALAALATSGSVDHIVIDQTASGVTTTLGGWPWVIMMSGYLGATLFGAACLHLGRQRDGGRRGLILMGALVLAITGLWIPLTANLFGFVSGIGIGAILFAAGCFLKEPVAQFVTSFLSVQLCLNALFDIRALLHLTFQTDAANDAVFMSQHYGLAPWFWASVWAVVAVTILAMSLKSYWRR